MVARMYPVTVTVPAGTTAAAPLATPVVLEDNNLDTVRIIVPPGHFALTGFAILWGGAPFYPFTQGQFITTDDEVVDYPYNGQVTETGLSVVSFNTDVFDHKFYFRFQISDLVTQSPVTIVSPQASGLVPAATAAAIASLTGGPAASDELAGDLAADLAAAGVTT